MKDLQWQQFIVSDKDVLPGKPVIKGTRIAVEHIVSLLAQGWTEEKILKNYPRITPKSLQAVFLFLYDCMKDGLLFLPSRKAL